MIGKAISHYKIIEKLGGGGMGVVYKAQDLKLDRFVALKFLPPELTSDEESKKRFIHEAKAASTLEHSNICNIHEIDETDDGQIFMVISCYDGETLKKKIESGPLKTFLSPLTFNKEALEFHKRKVKSKTVLIYPNISSIYLD
jgi:serine/threonine protein kinase